MDLICHEPLSDLMKTYSPAPDAPESFDMMQQPSRSPWAAHQLQPADHVGPLQVLLELEGSQLPQSPCYLERQPVIRAGHRAYLVQWLHRACFSLDLELSAFALAVRLLDRFLEVCMVQEGQVKEAQCAAVACLTIAAKLDGTPDVIANVADYQVQTDKWLTNFSAGQIRDMELTVLGALDWRPMSATAPDFLDRLLAVADVGRHGTAVRDAVRTSAICTIVDALLDSGSVELKPSCIAAFSILASMRNCCSATEVVRVSGTFFAFLDQDQLALLTNEFINNYGPAAPLPARHIAPPARKMASQPLQIPVKAAAAHFQDTHSPTSVAGLHHAQPGTPDSQASSNLDEVMAW